MFPEDKTAGLKMPDYLPQQKTEIVSFKYQAVRSSNFLQNVQIGNNKSLHCRIWVNGITTTNCRNFFRKIN